jgi:hypothetical protein
MAASHRFNGFLGWPLRQPIVKGKIANDTELSNPLILLTAPSIDWSGREDLNLRPPRPGLWNYKLQVLYLVSLREQRTTFSLAQLY